MIIWLYGLKPLILGYHAFNFGSFSHCGSLDKICLICDVI